MLSSLISDYLFTGSLNNSLAETGRGPECTPRRAIQDQHACCRADLCAGGMSKRTCRDIICGVGVDADKAGTTHGPRVCGRRHNQSHKAGEDMGVFFGILFKVLRAGIQTCITNYVYILQPQR
jgi:hypothetical protein